MAFLKRAAIGALSLSLFNPVAQPKETPDDIFPSRAPSIVLNTAGCSVNGRLIRGETLVTPSYSDLEREMRKNGTIKPNERARIDQAKVMNYLFSKTSLQSNLQSVWRSHTLQHVVLMPDIVNESAADDLAAGWTKFVTDKGEELTSKNYKKPDEGITLRVKGFRLKMTQDPCVLGREPAPRPFE